MRPYGFLGGSHAARWRGSRTGLRSKKLAKSVTEAFRPSRVPLHMTESLETAGSLGGRGPSDSLASAQYQGSQFPTALWNRTGGGASWPTQAGSRGCRGLLVLPPKVAEWLGEARWSQSGHFSV